MFFGLPYAKALCCGFCVDCRSHSMIGAYLGWSLCGGKVRLSRQPEFLSVLGAVTAEGIFQHWHEEAFVDAPDLVDGSTTYRCVGVAGSQTSDGSWQKPLSYDHVYYQLHYAPVSDLSTTTPRAALAKIAIHDPSGGALVLDPFNRQFDLVDCWFINDDDGDPYYWDEAWKLCNYWEEGEPCRRVCVGPDHFAIVERRYSGLSNNRVTYWQTGVSTATVETWTNPETMTDTSGDWIVAAFCEHTFPQAIAIKAESTTESYGLASVNKFTQHGPANLGTMELQVLFDEVLPGSGDDYNYELTCSRSSVDGDALTSSNTSMMVNDFCGFGAYVSTTELDFVPWEYGTGTPVPSRWFFSGYSLMTMASSEGFYATQYKIKGFELATDEDPTPGRFSVFDHPLYAYTGTGILSNGTLVDSSTLYSTSSIHSTDRPEGTVQTQTGKRLYSVPGNSRCGPGDAIDFSRYTDASGDYGNFAPFAVYISGGYNAGLAPVGPSLVIYGGLGDFFGTNVPTVKHLFANGAAPGDYAADHVTCRLMVAAHSHPAVGMIENGGGGEATQRGVKYVIHNFPLSLCPDPVVDGPFTFEPDAVPANAGGIGNGEQIAESYDLAAPLEDWNVLAHPDMAEATARNLETRWCYHWVGIDAVLYPMVRVNAQGLWEPRQPPRGIYWDTDGIKQTVDSLGWDSSPDDLHPQESLWDGP